MSLGVAIPLGLIFQGKKVQQLVEIVRSLSPKVRRVQYCEITSDRIQINVIPSE